MYINHQAVSYSSLKNYINHGALLSFKDTKATIKGKLFEEFLQKAKIVNIQGFADYSIEGVEFVDISEYLLEKAYNEKEIIKGKKYDIYNNVVTSLNDNKTIYIPEVWEIEFNKMLENILKLKYLEYDFSEILEYAQFQKEYYGELFNTPCKAKIDIEFNDLEKSLIFDLKTVSDLDRFKWQYKDGYYIQDYIYCKLAEVDKMAFIAVETKEPFNAQIFVRSDEFTDTIEYNMSKYIPEYWDWKNSGAIPKGIKDTYFL